MLGGDLLFLLVPAVWFFFLLDAFRVFSGFRPIS
jgi:hypothetical protein